MARSVLPSAPVVTTRRSIPSFPTPRARLALLAILLLAVGCADQVHVVRNSSGGSHWVRDGNRWQIRQVDENDGSRLEVVLETEEASRSGITQYRLVSASLFPPGDPLPRLWRILGPGAALRTTDADGSETVLEHPDRAVLATLPEDPRLEVALALLPRCLHYDSRGRILARAAAGTAGKRSFDALAEVLEAGTAGPFGALPTDGSTTPPGGVAARALAPAIAALAARDDLSRTEYDRLARLVDRLPTSSLAVEHLERLVGRASVTVLADSAPRIATSSGRAAVLSRLSALPTLTDPEVVAICRASTTVGSSDRQTRILLSLADDGPIAPVLDATSHIGSSSGRTEVLSALARRRPLAEADAIAIARDSTQLGSSDGQTAVLLLLVEVAPTPDIVAAQQAIGSSSGRTQVLLALAREPELDAKEATRLARATTTLGSSSGQTEVLEVLAPHAPIGEILQAAMAIGSSSDRTEVLAALTRRPTLTTAEADEIANASRRLGSSSGQTSILEELVGNASVEAILSAISSIGSASGRAAVLDRLARVDALTPEEAEAIARATPELSSNSETTGTILRALEGRASSETIIAGVGRIPSNQERTRTLRSLARRPDLSPAEADRLARASQLLSTSDTIQALLSDLIGHASIDAIVEASARMPSASTRAELLLRLANQRGLTAADAGRIARGAGELASGSRGMSRILQALVPVAPVDAILDAAARIPAVDERAGTLAALASRPKLSAAEGARIAGATRSLAQSDEIIEVLTTLLGRAPRSAIESAARRIPSDARREAFLRQLETASEPPGQ